MLLPLLLNNLLTRKAGGSYGSGSARRRYLVQRGDRLLVFASRQAAEAELQAQEQIESFEPQELVPVQPVQPTVVQPEMAQAVQTIDLPAMREWARWAGQLAEYNAAYQSRHFGALLALFEQLQDEEDVELLLMTL